MDKTFRISVYPSPIDDCKDWVAKVVVPTERPEDCWAVYFVGLTRGQANRKARRWCRRHVKSPGRMVSYNYTPGAS